MAVKHFQRGERVAARIITVDPSQRRVEGTLKDGAMIQIRVWEIPSIFRWPASGEVWLIQRNGAYWELVSRIENNEDTTGQIENVAEGVTQIHGTQVKMGDGRDVVVTDEALAANGDAPLWNATDKLWVPGPVGGTGTYAARRNHAAPNRLYQDAGTPTTWWLPLDSANGTYDFNTAESAGWTTVDHAGTGRQTLLIPPSPGGYSIGASMQVGYVSGMTNGDLAEHLLFVIGKDGGGSWTNTLLFDNKSAIHSDASIATTSGFAPVVDPTGGANTPEIGFACGISTATLSVQPSTVFTFGWPPLVWTYKIA